MAVSLETELYGPVKAFFVSRGYEVKAEVRGCDLVAFRAGEPDPVIAELKRTFTLPLLLQGIERQKTGAAVWLAVERNRTRRGAASQRYPDLTALCRRLGLGLLTVTFYKTKEPVVEVWCEPAGPGESGPSAAAVRLRREFAARSGDYNVGGSSGRKLVTAYRERAIQCALALACRGPASPKRVTEWTGCPNSGVLLRDNYYGWFRRLSRGVYAIAPEGLRGLAEFEPIARTWAARYPWAAGWTPDGQEEMRE
jgi:hypothetical protein